MQDYSPPLLPSAVLDAQGRDLATQQKLNPHHNQTRIQDQVRGQVHIRNRAQIQTKSPQLDCGIVTFVRGLYSEPDLFQSRSLKERSQGEGPTGISF